MTQQSNENNIPNHWQVKKLGEVCDKISLNKIKIKQKDYLSAGKFPVIDQGQDLIGGYLKTYTYKEACKNWWDKYTDEERAVIMSMPNFNKEKFKQITGIEV